MIIIYIRIISFYYCLNSFFFLSFVWYVIPFSLTELSSSHLSICNMTVGDKMFRTSTEETWRPSGRIQIQSKNETHPLRTQNREPPRESPTWTAVQVCIKWQGKQRLRPDQEKNKVYPCWTMFMRTTTGNSQTCLEMWPLRGSSLTPCVTQMKLTSAVHSLWFLCFCFFQGCWCSPPCSSHCD